MRAVRVFLVVLMVCVLWACTDDAATTAEDTTAATQDTVEDGDAAGTDTATSGDSTTGTDTASADSNSADVPVTVGDGHVVVSLLRRTATGEDVAESYDLVPQAFYNGGYSCDPGGRCEDHPWIWTVWFTLPFEPEVACALRIHETELATNSPPAVGTTAVTSLPLPGCGVAAIMGGQPILEPTRMLDLAGEVAIEEVVPVDTVSGAFEGNSTIAYDPATGMGDAVAFSVTSIRFRKLAFGP